MIADSPNWTERFALGPVRFDITCDACGRVWRDVSAHNLNCSRVDYDTLGICARRNGLWLCKECAPLR